MDDEPHVGFVDTHTEGIGRDDHAQDAAHEALLDLALGAGLEPRVEKLTAPSLARDVLAEYLGVTPRRREDDGAPAVADERLAHEIEDAGGLLRLGHRDDLVLQIARGRRCNG